VLGIILVAVGYLVTASVGIPPNLVSLGWVLIVVGIILIIVGLVFPRAVP